MVRAASELRDAGTDWSCRVAGVLIGCPEGVSSGKKRTVFADASAGADPDGEVLISWVIAPAKRA
jgi:hypothetical protein